MDPNNKFLIQLCFWKKENSIEVIKNILQTKDVDVNVSNVKGQTALYAACCSGFLEAVEILLQVEGIDIIQHDPLTMAATHGYNEIVKLVLLHDNKMLIHSIRGLKVLYRLFQHSKSVENIKIILEETPFWLGHPKVACLLMNTCILNCQLENLKLLIEYQMIKCSWNIIESALLKWSWMNDEGLQTSEEYLNQIEMLKFFISQGCYVSDWLLSRTQDKVFLNIFHNWRKYLPLWSPQTHHYYPREFKKVVFEILLICNRMQTYKDMRLLLCQYIAIVYKEKQGTECLSKLSVWQKCNRYLYSFFI